MPHLSILSLGCILLLIQTVLSGIFVYPFTPNLLLPLAMHMGVSGAYQLGLGASCVFVLGYLADSFSGSPIGLQTLVLVSTFLVARMGAIRFSMRQVGIQFVLAFFVTLLCGAITLLLQTVFSNPMPFRLNVPFRLLWLLLGSSFSVAVCAPMIFVLAQGIESRNARYNSLRYSSD